MGIDREMGLFGRRKAKKENKPLTEGTQSTPASSAGHTNENSNDKPISKSSPNPIPKRIAEVNGEPSLDQLPQLINDIKTTQPTSADKPARALRLLFSLSEQSTSQENRTLMIQNKQLVPALLNFLQRCAPGSSEQYLALLVLNNLSIPSKNKHLIALGYGGVRVFSKLLCEDPACHLVAIILVNITFADSDLRRELASEEYQLIPSLAYALRLSCMSEVEYENHEPLTGQYDIEEKLREIVDNDTKMRSVLSDSTSSSRDRDFSLDIGNQVYPETARWCLAALKNLTRPSSPHSSQSVVDTGILPLIMGIINIVDSRPDSFASPVLSAERPTQVNSTLYSPANWDSNSVQDAALFVIMNLAAATETRDKLMQADAVHILSMIADYTGDGLELTDDGVNQMEFQAIKARIALAYLVGSSGHFGQLRGRNTIATYVSADDSALILSDAEALLFVELLANTLHRRAKEGPGGYSAATFHAKWVIVAIRCLLTHDMNQTRFVNTAGAQINALLLKALAEHSLRKNPGLDAEAAESAAFALYLLSNYGFNVRFLPSIFGDHDNLAGTGSLAAKVLSSYIHQENITPAGHHAADQLLLRLRYLCFKGSVAELSGGPFDENDFVLDKHLVKATETITVETRAHGARPLDAIFDRPILRARIPNKGLARAPWNENRSIRVFPSALHAVQELSFGSSRVRHMDAIDDILIANNIANSANGEKTESYNYIWTWQDAAGEIQKNLEPARSGDTASIFSGTSLYQVGAKDEPMSIFGLRCSPMGFCQTDTTTQ